MQKLFSRSLALVLILGALGLAAQPEKPVVAVLKFTYSQQNRNLDKYIGGVQNQVESGVLGTKRFIVVERSAIDQLQGEIQTQEVLSEAQVAELGKVLGAKYVFLGSLDNASTEPVYYDDNGVKKLRGYKANVTFQLKLVDVESTQIIASEQIASETGGLFGAKETEGEAISEAIGAISGLVEIYIAKNLPVIIDILEIKTKDKKNTKAETVEVFAGADAGLKPKDRLELVEVTVREIRGRKIETRTPFGELRVETVTGPETAICSVVKGGEVLLQKFTPGSTTILAVFSGVNKSIFGR